MFRATFPDARYLLDLFKAISVVAEEACFRISPDTMAVKAVDPSAIAMVDFSLARGAAEEWELDGHDGLKIAVSVSEMLKIIGGARGGEAVTITYSPEEKKVRFVLAEATGSKRRDIYLETLEGFEERDLTPRVDFKAMASLATMALREGVEVCRILDDTLRVAINPEAVELSASGEYGSVLVRFPRYGSIIYELEADQEACSYYGIPFLSKMLKAGASLSESTRIELGDNTPMRMGFQIPCGKLEYYLAPTLRS